MNAIHTLRTGNSLRLGLLFGSLSLCLQMPAWGATYLIGLNEKYEQFSEFDSLLRDDDTILVTTPISSYGYFDGLRITIRAKNATPKLVWDAGFDNLYYHSSTLEVRNKSRVTVENLEIRGGAGSGGSSYCPLFSCESGSSGGRGKPAVMNWLGSTIILKNCDLRGGVGGRGGIYGTRSCAVCGCSPCGGGPPVYAASGETGFSLDLRDASVAETLSVKVDSVHKEGGGRVIACCSTPPVGLNSARSHSGPGPTSLMSLEREFHDIRGRKNAETRSPSPRLFDSRRHKTNGIN